MSSRSILFVSSDSLSGGVDAATLRAHLGRDVTVKEAVFRGEYGFLVETPSVGATEKILNALKGGRRDQQGVRPQVSRSYSRESAETYSSAPSSHLHAQTTAQSITPYMSPRHTRDTPQWSNPSKYGVSPGRNEAHHAVGMESLSRQGSRNDPYDLYSESDRPAASYAYASSGGSQPIDITSPRRPSAFSVGSDDSFDSTYGFRGSVNSPASHGYFASPRSGLRAPVTFSAGGRHALSS